MKIDLTKTCSILFLLIALLFFQASFAANVNSLLEAIRQNNIEDVKLILQEGVDPKDVNYFNLLLRI